MENDIMFVYRRIKFLWISFLSSFVFFAYDINVIWVMAGLHEGTARLFVKWIMVSEGFFQQGFSCERVETAKEKRS